MLSNTPFFYNSLPSATGKNLKFTLILSRNQALTQTQA